MFSFTLPHFVSLNDSPPDLLLFLRQVLFLLKIILCCPLELNSLLHLFRHLNMFTPVHKHKYGGMGVSSDVMDWGGVSWDGGG